MRQPTRLRASDPDRHRGEWFEHCAVFGPGPFWDVNTQHETHTHTYSEGTANNVDIIPHATAAAAVAYYALKHVQQ